MAEEALNAEEAAAAAAADFIFGPEENVNVEGDEPEPEAEEEPEAESEEDSEEEPEEDSEEEGKEEDSDEFVEVEFDGKLYEVPLELKDALLRQADYTQKTQELSAKRKEQEVLLEQVQQKAQEFEFAQSVWDDVLKVQQLQGQAEQYNQYLRDNIDSLSSTDIEKIRLAIQDAKDESQQLAFEIQQKQQESQQAQQQAVKELLDKGTEVLRSRIPGWGEDHQKRVREYALSSGFSEQEINAVFDPRQVEVLWKAAQYDDLQSGKAQAVKKVQSAPKVRAKSRNPMPKEVGQKLNLRKKLKSQNLTNADKANLIGDDIASRFFGR